MLDRRNFIAQSTLLAGATVLPTGIGAITLPKAPLHKKSLKWYMIKDELSVLQKFQLAKELGFQGIELDSPDQLDDGEVLEAIKETGIVVPGLVNSLHWKKPLSSPVQEDRDTCTQSIIDALHRCKKLGGTTVLVVAGVVNKEVSYQEAYMRSQNELRKVLPAAHETGIKIAIENVWNNFLLSPLEAAAYIDEFNDPMIGWYMDIGNVVRYGWPEHWIRTLGSRILKVDIKEYSRKKQSDEGIWKGFKVPIGDGDCDWNAVNKALAEVGYSGWGSAEVPGGDKAHLADVSARMDRIFAA